VIVALLSRFWLYEPISIARWAGILLITVGVGFVAQGPSRTEPVQEIQQLPEAAEPTEAVPR
jgi:drug/metabolite transporter (DMT)-like permease